MNQLLLLHGALGTAQQLQPLAQTLSTDRDVHTLNFSGHGGTDVPKNGYTFDVFVADILQYLDANGLKQVDIFGYSMGGYAALCFALKHPERVGKIATLGSKLRWTAAGAQQEIKSLDADKIEAKVPAFAEQLKQQHGEGNWRNVLAATADMMVGLGDKPSLSDTDFPAVTHSVLLGIGDRDNMAGLEDTVTVYRQLPKAQLWVLPGTPHPMEKVNTALLANGLRRFLSDN
ncbi:hypothetical protein BH09BAC1_BH09BAC1_06860 [soil metagenome]